MSRWALVHISIGIMFLFVTWVSREYGSLSTAEAIYLATGLALAAYTVETYRLRREAQLQTELQNRPFLSLVLVGDRADRRAMLVNIGKGLARNIRLADTQANPALELRGGSLTHLVPGDDMQSLPYRVWFSLRPTDPLTEAGPEENGWYIAQAIETQGAAIAVSYASIAGQWYETTIRMVGGVPQIISDRRRHAPRDGASDEKGA